MRLTRNFDSSEFDVHEPWPATLATKRQQLANLLQWFRELAGVPAFITSAYRSPGRNTHVGGAENSQHTAGEAADVVFVGISDQELARRLLEAEARGTAPLYGQFIVYEDTAHTHVSLPRSDGRKNREKLIAYKAGGRRAYRVLERPDQLPATLPASSLAIVAIGAGLALLSRGLT